MLRIQDVKFAQLHVHNQYSIKDGLMSQAKHISKAKELGLYAIAETNHGKMYGSYAFYKNCTATEDKKKNPLTPIKPIIGVEAYVCPSLDALRDKSRKKRYYHLVLLAKNYEGYVELCNSTRVSEKQTFRDKPVLTDDDLARFFSNGNIIALSACLGGEIQQLLFNGKKEEAKDKVLFYKELFKSDFYMELQNHHMGQVAENLIKEQVILAKECGVDCVITSDAHFANAKDKKFHDILICMQYGTKLSDYQNKAYTKHHCLKSKEELFEDFRGILPDNEILTALNNTGLIADKCDFKFPKGNHYPKFPDLKNGETSDEMLRDWAFKGLEKNVVGYNLFSDKKKEEYIERIEEELYVIKTAGYSDYFLIVSDVLAYYDSIGGYSGLGRGSVVGSLVSYAIGITKVDPIEHGLYFDRFLNLERVSPPDADLDFDNQRPEIFDYTVKKYGENKVCKIITFGTLGAKAALRAVGRVLDIPLFFVDKVAKAFPSRPGVTMSQALDLTDENYSVEFDSLYKNDNDAKELIDIASEFEGVIDHTGVHAAACIIGDGELSNYIPLQWDKDSGMWVSQFYKDYNEELGCLKMDYLGLNNLTIIKETARLVNEKYNLNLTHAEIIALALADENVVKEIYAKGLTKLVFQFESKGMRDTLLSFNPKTLNDLILLNAVYRPGPLQYIPNIIANKNNLDGIKYDHECLRPILSETYGYPVFQEQIMTIFRVICGYSLGKADLIRRAMGKKDMNILSNARKDFVDGYLKLGLTEERANEFFDEIMEFAKYSFNKSHAAAYTITSLETAFLKLNYPQEYMTACLSYIPTPDAYPLVLEECKDMGLEILRPCVNKSDVLFSPEGDKGIRFGLSCIKGVGKSAKEIVQSRPYNSFVDFVTACGRFSDTNKGKIESLAYAGAFDGLNINRATAIHNIPLIQEYKKSKKKVSVDQMDFFSLGLLSNEDTMKLEEINEMPYQMKLENEYEVLFSYVSGHPLDQYRAFCEFYSERDIIDLTPDDDESEFYIVGRVKESSTIYRKKDNAAMGRLVIEDLTGNINAIAFTKEYAAYKEKLVKGSVMKFRVKAQVEVEEREDDVVFTKQFIIREVSGLEAVDKAFVKVRTMSDISKAEELLRDNMGGTQIMFYVADEKKLIRSNYLVNLTEEIKSTFGSENIAI